MPGIYSIGNVIGPPMYAHKASKEEIVAAEVITGMSSEADFAQSRGRYSLTLKLHLWGSLKLRPKRRAMTRLNESFPSRPWAAHCSLERLRDS